MMFNNTVVIVTMFVTVMLINRPTKCNNNYNIKQTNQYLVINDNNYNIKQRNQYLVIKCCRLK